MSEMVPHTKTQLQKLYTDEVERIRQEYICVLYHKILDAAKEGKTSRIVTVPYSFGTKTHYTMNEEDIIQRLKVYFPDCSYQIVPNCDCTAIVINWS